MILITGATGLIGQFIASNLLDKGIKFKALKRDTSKIPAILTGHTRGELIQWIDGDIRDPIRLMEVFDDVDQVIHCAAIVSYHPGDYRSMMQTNVLGTSNLINASLEKGVKRFVHFSSVAALGRSSVIKQVNESMKWTKSSMNSYYGETKHLAELEVWRGYEEGLPVVILNPSVVIGPADWNKSSSQIFKYVWEENKFYTKGSLKLIDVRDVAKIAIQMLESNVVGERFILHNAKIDYKELLDLIARSFNKKAPAIEATPKFLRLAAFFEKIKSIFIGTRPLITSDSIRSSVQDIDYNNDKIKSFMDFDFRSPEDTIVWTCRELMDSFSQKE